MATTRKTTTPTPVAQARQAVADATARHAAAEQAAALATTERAGQVERLAQGDESVTADDLLRSDAEAHRTALLLEHAARSVAACKAEQAITVATATAADLATLDGFDLADLAATTRATIAAALDNLRAQIDARNARLTEAMTTASGAGLIVGEADPMSPVLVKPKTYRSPEALIVNGAAVTAINAAESVAVVLAGVSA